ncbi:hypothetical protein DO70_6415 [Burkholderia pseudomallei]|nr:hypothetical protein DO70_6415 [Burkholderia pseudomallei]
MAGVAQHQPDAQAVRGRRAERDEQVHVAGASLQRVPCGAIEARAEAELHDRRERELQPRGQRRVDAERRGEHRQGERRGQHRGRDHERPLAARFGELAIVGARRGGAGGGRVRGCGCAGCRGASRDGRRRAIACPLHRVDEPRGVDMGVCIGIDGGFFGGEIDRRAGDAGHLRQRLLDAADAGRAGHARDVEFDCRARGGDFRRRCESACRIAHRRRAIACPLHRVDEPRGVDMGVCIGIDGGFFGGEIDRRAGDAGHLRQRLLDAADAGRAGHARDVEFERLRRHAFRRRGARFVDRERGGRRGRTGRVLERACGGLRRGFGARVPHDVRSIPGSLDGRDERLRVDVARDACLRAHRREIHLRIRHAAHGRERLLDAPRAAAAGHAADGQRDRRRVRRGGGIVILVSRAAVARIRVSGRGGRRRDCRAIAGRVERGDEASRVDGGCRGDGRRARGEIRHRAGHARHLGERLLDARRTAAAMHAFDEQCRRDRGGGSEQLGHLQSDSMRRAVPPTVRSINFPMMGRSSARSRIVAGCRERAAWGGRGGGSTGGGAVLRRPAQTVGACVTPRRMAVPRRWTRSSCGPLRPG